MAYNLTSLVQPAAEFDTVIDVRAPSEFAMDHMPGAINLPVLSDEERARVGTIYTQDSAFKARKIGAALVARNAATHIQGPLAEKDGGWRPLVYCWRGGQRSGSFASILSQIGWRVEVLKGGYQSYRRQVVGLLYDQPFPAPVLLLDGNTGTAKTALLPLLAARDVQVIDLEGLANHRGSALGARGDQPSQKMFESRLAAKVAALDPALPVVIEAESSRVGRLNLPEGLFRAMKAAPRYQIEAPLSARADFLCRAYLDVIEDHDALTARLDLLRPLQGHERVESWIALAQAGDFARLAEGLIQDHYDPRYRKLRQGISAPAQSFDTDTLDAPALEQLADRIAGAIGADRG